MSIQIPVENIGDIDNPRIGEAEIIFNGSTLVIKPHNAADIILATGITLEEVQDLLGTSFQDTANIEWFYDDQNDKFRASLSSTILQTIQNAIQPNQLATVATSGDFNDLINIPSIDISDYLDRKSLQQNNEQVNTTTVPQTRLNQNYIFKHVAKYKIVMDYTWAYDNTQDNFNGELIVDGNIVRRHEEEPQDSGGSDGGAGTDHRMYNSLVYEFDNTTPNNSVNIQFQWFSSQGGVEATIRDSNLWIERYI